LLSGILFLEFPSRLRAQEEAGDAPLGDIARSLRKKSSPSETVVDNDNLPKVMESAESLRAIRSSPVFSLDPGGKNFRVSSPDVTCSLSFTAKNSSLLSDPLMLDELPRAELSKLDGPATIDGDSLQVSIHNGSSWELREVMIGLTIVRRAEIQEGASYPGQARLVPAAAGSAQTQDSSQKQPDVTLLLRVKGSAAPAATAIFRTSLNFALFPDQDWHWAIVKAKGIAPQVLQEAGVVPNIGAYVSTPSSPGGQMSPLLPPPTKDSAFNPSPTSPDVAIH
jgi:hypothetical protein